ncbi:MAG: chorismate-binding protein, partial [Thiotrichaceae bacterium]|nr:chorismate-binding protein [Thiotrichaceae bacterium]
MTPEQFSQLVAEGYNRIPIQREILADIDTPLSVYLKLANGPYSYLFESVQGGEKWGRYSIIGLPAKTIVKVHGYEVSISTNNKITEQIQVADPLAWITKFLAGFHVPKLSGLPRFTGGLVGYFGYDTVRYIEPCVAQKTLQDPLKTPDILLMVSDEVIVFDNLKGKLYFIIHANPSQSDAYTKAEQRIDNLVESLSKNINQSKLNTSTNNKIIETDFKSGFPRSDFEKAIEHAKKYIVEGDVMQVVLSQRLSIACEVPPINVYRALRCGNPSPYMYYLDLGDFHIVGSSPEILVRLEAEEITVRPIAGTRPRGDDEAEDLALEKELLADPKERAEHLMLIDLGRNDVGRVAKIGSVELTENMIIERYSHVMHIVS